MDPQVKPPQFGARDTLFYLVPGSTVLAGILLLCGVSREDIIAFDGIPLLLAAVLAAYVIGQAVYPLALGLRWAISLGARSSEDESKFQSVIRKMMKENDPYYASLVFRDRSLARFTAAMVCPIGFLTFALWVWLMRKQSPAPVAVFVCCVGGLAALGFVIRFRRYDDRYRAQVDQCSKTDEVSTGSVHP